MFFLVGLAVRANQICCCIWKAELLSKPIQIPSDTPQHSSPHPFSFHAVQNLAILVFLGAHPFPEHLPRPSQCLHDLHPSFFCGGQLGNSSDEELAFRHTSFYLMLSTCKLSTSVKGAASPWRSHGTRSWLGFAFRITALSSGVICGLFI